MHIRLASNIAKYVAQWLFCNIYIVGSCEHFNFLIHQLIPDFIWAPSKDSFSKTIQACFENSLKTIQSDKDGAQMKSGISWCIKKLKCSYESTNKMLLNNECATYLENVPLQIFQSSKNELKCPYFLITLICYTSSSLVLKNDDHAWLSFLGAILT